MLKIPSKASVGLSLALSVVFFIGCVYLAFILPAEVKLFVSFPDHMGNRDEITAGGIAFLTVVAYVGLLFTVLADIMLFFLLIRVKNALVFTDISVFLIRGVSWCCFALCGALLLFSIYFQYALAAAFAAAFLGLCLRVVKNVIEEATRIKAENDLTV